MMKHFQCQYLQGHGASDANHSPELNPRTRQAQRRVPVCGWLPVIRSVSKAELQFVRKLTNFMFGVTGNIAGQWELLSSPDYSLTFVVVLFGTFLMIETVN